MEIRIEKNKILRNYDSGCREVITTITLAEDLTPRMRRQTVIYETLGAIAGYLIPHKQLEDITEILLDSLDQIEPLGDG